MPRWKLGSLSPERKMDVLGVVLIFIGLLSLLSLLSPKRGALTGWWVNALYIMAGWGAFLLPVALIAVGLWLVFRNVERLPVISTERLVGITLLFFNILAWLHLFTGIGWEIVAAKPGGGYLGAVFERGLVVSIGKVGAAVVLVGWLLIGLAFALDLSIQDLFIRGQPVLGRLRQALNKPTPSQTPAVQQPAPAHSKAGELPNGFQPLASRPGIRTEANRAGGAARPGTGLPSNQAPGQDVPSPTAAVPVLAANVPAWKLPAIDEILDPPIPAAIQSNLDYDRARVIENTLASFGVPVHVVEIHRGPTITQFGVEPDFIETRTGRTRVRVSKIVGLTDDLALALAAPRIRIQAPVPGRNYVGIEVPNLEISRVTLREVLESEVFQKLHSALRFSLGKDVAGKVVVCDLAAMPHLLIAGTTGSGKSVCVNAILCSLLMNNTPLDLRLVLVDPKRVELTGYNGIPHLMAPVVVEYERVISALQWMMREMDNRYHKFAKAGVRNIQEYNLRNPADHLPYLVVVVDELADLMMQAPDETERTITRLAQLARATGIHLILATQRPSVNVVTGLIKANFPARVAFMVAAMVDSRVILDQPG
ncbi:MAG: DNA translocase FtsK 4TM domain-containing protein, partial [Chloroflexi bacterium]|nr:DNA translocase FtsK 4TM domain-containing protein [Chloroflexota bacterium]